MRGSHTRDSLKAVASLRRLAGGGRPGRGPGGVREVDDRGIEPRFTAVSERRLPSRPAVDAAGAVGIRLRGPPIAQIPEAGRFAAGSPLQHGISMGRRQGVAPCSTDSQPAGSLQALRRSSPGGLEPPSPAVGARRSSI